MTLFKQKLETLRIEQKNFKDQTKVNEERGRNLTLKVMQTAQSNECEKYKLHVEETDKITSLLIGLSGRLAKAENALLCLTSDTEFNDQETVSISWNFVVSFAVYCFFLEVLYSNNYLTFTLKYFIYT